MCSSVDLDDLLVKRLGLAIQRVLTDWFHFVVHRHAGIVYSMPEVPSIWRSVGGTWCIGERFQRTLIVDPVVQWGEVG